MSHKTLESFRIYQNIHFIGIGGIGISALARILAKEGHQISGSDVMSTKNSDLLIAEGIKVKIGPQIPENIPKETNLVIYTTAIPRENPELIDANQRGLKLMSYPEAIGELTKSYRSICISGTHGKTTTTAMAGLILTHCGIDPTVIVGSLISEFDNKNERLGDSEILVLETCEYQEAFLNYQPSIVILNNVDPEHLDYFGTPANYLQAFQKFLHKLPPDGLLIANGDDLNISFLLGEKKWPFRVITFGRNPTNDVILDKSQISFYDGQNMEIKLAIPGEHNLMNATAALALAKYLDIDLEKALIPLKTFRGAARRFEIKGQWKQSTIIDDYGHTPAEIRATLQAAVEKFGTHSKILCIFQPHQYSRTRFFLDQFGASLAQAQKVLIPNIYRSRDTEEDLAKVSTDLLVSEINKTHQDLAINTHSFEETLNWIENSSEQFDAIITIGAGDITKLSDQILKLA